MEQTPCNHHAACQVKLLIQHILFKVIIIITYQEIYTCMNFPFYGATTLITNRNLIALKYCGEIDVNRLRKHKVVILALSNLCQNV